MRKAYIKSIRFNAKGDPTHATISTPHGLSKIEWRDAAGSWSAFAVDWQTTEALKVAMPYAATIERMAWFFQTER